MKKDIIVENLLTGYYWCSQQSNHSDSRASSATYRPPAGRFITGAISMKWRSGCWFMPEGTTINGPVYRDVLKQKWPQFIIIHDCDTFQQDGAPCHQTKPWSSLWIKTSLNCLLRGLEILQVQTLQKTAGKFCSVKFLHTAPPRLLTEEINSELMST